jgi:hypothetical protein
VADAGCARAAEHQAAHRVDDRGDGLVRRE